ncbi:NAD(P)H-dependent oxidoreductase [Brevifollis gellanilyticus]|uniref:NAD(P)H oxidoreductase n=1 Tax=Brevifollis gellanilyticus TaxID=748831 RepID=A0A512MB48_9BACT|nr:NAD(P)H-dependent oxidoreductase [Brevifollis gellanilyticus]GEP43561.1 NAD(P)H oxidoreductase [Brevifollis gellanilyticus]
MSSPAPGRVLILFAHPALHRSRINLAMMDAVQDLEGVTVRDLYEVYPDFHVEVSTEQELLVEHDVIIWQHPFYWYSAPALLKEWMDVVLEYGFAYGDEGRALHGKRVMSALTTGGPEDAYDRAGYNRFSMRELLAPFDQTAHLCGMKYLDPFILHGVNQFSPEQVTAAAASYRKRIQELLA